MESTFTATGQRASAPNASTTTWANDAFTRVLHVPIRELRREGTPEEASPKFLGDVLQTLQRTYRRREDPETGDVSYDYAPRGGLWVTAGGELATAHLASLGHRAQVLIDDALGALDGIVPIGITDPEALGITRGLVREQLQLLVRELSDEPAPPHVNQIFESLLGADRSKLTGGHIGELAVDAGLHSDSIVTQDHEASLTNWQILRDHVASLAGNWEEILGKGEIAEHPLTRAAEAIATVARSADAAWEALADEGLDEDTLDLLELGPDDTGDEVVVAERNLPSLGRLLVEVRRQAPFWRQLADVGGRRGVRTVGPHAARLRRQLDRLLQRVRVAEGKGPARRLTTREILLALKEEDQFTPFWKSLALMREGLIEIEDVAGEIEDNPDEGGQV